MAKQILEIEVPEGKKAVWKDGKVIFEDEHLIKTVEDAKAYLRKMHLCPYILDTLARLPEWSFEYKIASYRAVVAAITHDERRYLTTGKKWYPIIEFCRPGKLKNCWGDTILGRIESEGEEFDVVGGSTSDGANTGLGCFGSHDGVSLTGVGVGFRSVGSKKAALYISKQFGKLLFEISYGGVNCEWKWVDL